MVIVHGVDITVCLIIIVLLFSFGLLPKLGWMGKAYNRVRTTGQTYSPESRDLNLEDDEENNPSARITGNVLDFVLPIGVLIVLAMCQGELFLAVVASILTCMVLYIPRKKLSPARYFDLAMHGFCNMILTIAIIFFAFVMQEAIADIGIAGYVIHAVRPIMNAPVFPMITFLLVAVLNFSTGSIRGITSIVTPIILPLCFSDGVNPLLRKQKGLTQKEMAEAVGVEVSTIAMWESGKRTPSFKLLNDLSDLFDKSIDYILGISDDDRSPKLNDAQVEQLGTWEIQSELIDILRQYLQLDEYGKMNVRSLLNRELVRCQEQGTANSVGGLKIGIQYNSVEQ